MYIYAKNYCAFFIRLVKWIEKDKYHFLIYLDF